MIKVKITPCVLKCLDALSNSLVFLDVISNFETDGEYLYFPEKRVIDMYKIIKGYNQVAELIGASQASVVGFPDFQITQASGGSRLFVLWNGAGIATVCSLS